MFLANRRREKRYRLRLPTQICHQSGSANTIREYFEYTGNISSGGAFIATQNPLPSGSEVELGFLLPVPRNVHQPPSRGWVKVAGEVIRADSGGMAVVFHEECELRRLWLS